MSQSTELEERKAYILFAAIGIGYLFPFSALTQPVDYWAILFPDFNIEFPLTAVYMWVNLIVLTLLVFFGGDPIYKNRIYGGFFGQLIVLIIVPTSWFLHLSERSNYAIIMGCTTVAAIVTAFIDSCAISFSAQVYFAFKVHYLTFISHTYSRRFIFYYILVSIEYTSWLAIGHWS